MRAVLTWKCIRLSQNTNIIEMYNKAIQILNQPIFFMSLNYHYRKFQPRRLKFVQDMATNQWPVSHDKDTEDW